MLEEALFYIRETPGLQMGLWLLGFACVLLLVMALTRSARKELMQRRFVVLPFEGRMRRWAGENSDKIALGVGVLCLMAMAALMVKPIRLLNEGRSADAVVTSLVEGISRDSREGDSIWTNATIQFEAGERTVRIQRSTSRKSGSICISGCYYKGQRLKVLYFPDDPHGAELHTFFGLFGMTLFPAVAGALAFLFWWILRAERIASGPGLNGPAAP